MTLQNRVLPDGAIVAHPARGLFMGNRGILHGGARDLGAARWRHKAWVCCVLCFKGRKRSLMTPNRYTELFFLDEATALAAGHRPCAECRRADFLRFRALWPGGAVSAPALDQQLHDARALRGGRHLRRWTADAATLPPYTFITTAEGLLLLTDTAALVFAPGGYQAQIARPLGCVTVLTPEPTVAVLRAGFLPQLHPSAQSFA